jgi:hypothetical protein
MNQEEEIVWAAINEFAIGFLRKSKSSIQLTFGDGSAIIDMPSKIRVHITNNKVHCLGRTPMSVLEYSIPLSDPDVFDKVVDWMVEADIHAKKVENRRGGHAALDLNDYYDDHWINKEVAFKTAYLAQFVDD